MEMRLRRTSRKPASSSVQMSSSSSRIFPALGSLRRLMQRASVDLPEPDSPMIMYMEPDGLAQRLLHVRLVFPGMQHRQGSLWLVREHLVQVLDLQALGHSLFSS